MVPSRHGDGAELESNFDELSKKLIAVAKSRSDEIQKGIDEEKKKNEGTIKILILGGPSSGKSTIFKQMRIIHQDGFKSMEQLLGFKELIYSNIRDSFRQLCNGAIKLSVDNREIEDLTMDIAEFFKVDSVVQFDKDVVEQLKSFWRSAPIQEVYSKRYEFELMDSTKYFLENIDRIADNAYLPNEEDIVHSRKPTRSINHMRFPYTGLKLHMVDVGGQKSERRKWIYQFEDVRVVIFVVDLTGFAKQSEESRDEIERDTKLFHNWTNDVHDMKVALKIFHDVVNSTYLENAVFLLFFNKVDAFKELLPHVRLNSCFSKFTGENSYEITTEFIRKKFMRASKSPKSMFPHFTTATNTENIKLVFRACMESVFKANSRATGLT